uniref:BED-type domain-containing protein n=1 Tax=Glossina austeni TaxID=7395 RepID=A0A1A9V3F6_GLOAU
MPDMSSSDNESNKELPIRKRKSLVWKYFEKLSRARVRCRVCRHEQNYQGNTGNILRHLKAKHQIDATQRGQRDPENLQRMKELNSSASHLNDISTAVPIKTENQPTRRVSRTHLTSYCDEPDIDPYEDNEPLVNFINTDFISTERDECYNGSQPSTKRKSSLEDARIIAETEYFREKAAYFRIQKHLSALQAKKVKFELEQLYLNCNKSNS